MYIGASSSDGELAEKYWDGKYRNQKLRKSAEWVRHLFELSDQLKQQARAPSAVTEVVEEWERDAERSREARCNRQCEELGLDASLLSEDMDPFAAAR